MLMLMLTLILMLMDQFQTSSYYKVRPYNLPQYDDVQNNSYTRTPLDKNSSYSASASIFTGQ